MKIKDYQTIIDKTAVYPKEFGAAYTTLGLVGESGELYDSLFVPEDELRESIRVLKEVGDVAWYITATANEFNIPLEKVFTNGEIPIHFSKELFMEDLASDGMIYSTRLAELVKKTLRDGDIPTDKIISNLKEMYFILRRISELLDTTFEDVLEINYNKLIKRRETNTLHGSGDNREDG